ncbi:MAG TPA: hypothetical protein VFG35_00840 [Actinoplanes sp.]|nr:hypothetical protein [Actinoplanes sp.]
MAASLTYAQAEAAPSHSLDDTFVLHGRQLRAGTELTETSRFAEDVWRLTPAIQQRQQPSLALTFTDVPERYRPTAKQLCYSLLSGPLPPGERQPALATIHPLLGELRNFFSWLAQQPSATRERGGPALTELSGTDLLEYQRHLVATRPHLGQRDNARRTIRRLWRHRTALTGDHLLFDPRHIDGWGESRGRHTGENATDRIPESVHGPLLTWALRFVDDFAADIIAAEQRRRRLQQSRRSRPKDAYGQVGKALRALLDDHLAERRPLPGFRGKVNLHHLADTIGCSHRLLSLSRAEINAVAAVTGITTESPYDITITGRLDGQPWLDAITTHGAGEKTLRRLLPTLQAACYTVIAFQSGMRDSEIKHLRRNCLQTLRNGDDRPYRWKVTSLAFKGERDPTGTPATWVVGQSAARAIAVLESLQPAATSLLFTSVTGGTNIRDGKTADAALTTIATNLQLNNFIHWVTDYCQAQHRNDAIPPVDGRPWRLSTRQFRRTLAWFIARRPGGAIAGAIAYRHLSIQMFEGYAGTSDSGFRAEVESEQALARGEHLLAMIDSYEHAGLIGPATDEATRRLEQFAAQASFNGKVITDDRRLLRLMRRDDPAIYPGRYVTCVHNHATALCRQHRNTSGEAIPTPSDCRPLSCRNVTLTAGNVDAWITEIADLDRRLSSRPLLPPLLQRELERRRDELTGFLDRHRRSEP